jgi:hypothetical protein
MSKYMILGKSEDVLKPGGRMKKLKKHLPPGKMMALLIEAIRGKNCSDGP